MGATSARPRACADTLEALNEQRVEGLLVQESFRAEGYTSPRADFLSAEPGASPTGEELQQRDDVIESAMERALEQSAEVSSCATTRTCRRTARSRAVLRF